MTPHNTGGRADRRRHKEGTAMTLLLTARDIEHLMDMQGLITALESAQIEYSRGHALQPIRSRLAMPEHPGAVEIMPGYLAASEILGVKVLALRWNNPAAGQPLIHATMLLLDPVSGRLEAIMDGGSLTAFRTAAVSGVATRHLARKDACALAIIGTGRQPRTHLEAMLCVRAIERVTVYNRTIAKAAQFKDEMQDKFQIAIEIAASGEAAVSGADIVVLSTTTTEPVLSAAALRAGLHINSIASATPRVRELDSEAIQGAKVVVDSREAALEEAGDLLIPMAEGRITADHIYGEIGEIAGGSKPGRTDDREITVYKALGLAIQDAAAANWLLQKARARGSGQTVDL